jgi:hypothetical protein
MDGNRERIRDLMIARTMDKLKKNNMDAAYLPSEQDIIPYLRSMIDEHSVIAYGGSMTLVSSGVLKFLRTGNYRLIDHTEPNLTPQEVYKRRVAAYDADIYLTSVNAITEHGELYCVDGFSNRVSAMLFGPRKVLVIAGCQKIVPNLRDAVDRVKHVAGPANAIRLSRDTHCSKTGYCIAPFCDDRNLMSIPTQACDNGICSNMVVFGRQAVKSRISVLIVGEEIGY